MINLPVGKTLSEKQTKLVLGKFDEAQYAPRYSYEWKGEVSNEVALEESVKHMPRSILPFVGYGSLLNSASASFTFKDEILRYRRPVIVFGARRVFNYSMGPAVERYGKPEHDIDSAALNIRLTGSVEDTLNAVLIEIPLSEIPALRKREIGYDLEPVACIDWNGLEKRFFIAYLLLCPDEPRLGKKRTDNTLMPHRNYYLVCKEGAKEFGEPFLQYWLSTTYLADGITSVNEWESIAGE
jgi:hypothetical protein